MSLLQTYAKALDLKNVKLLCNQDIDLNGTLLAACSAKENKNIQVEIIEYLISKGADVHETDKNGVTPLHRAVRFRSPQAVQALIRNGANVNAVDKRSYSTPLHRAVYHSGAPSSGGKKAEAMNIIQLLLENGASPSLKNRSDKTPKEYITDPDLAVLFKEYQE